MASVICRQSQLSLFASNSCSSSSPTSRLLSAFAGWILPRACQVYEQSAMAETEQDRAVLPPRGAGLSAEAGKTPRASCQLLVCPHIY